MVDTGTARNTGVRLTPRLLFRDPRRAPTLESPLLNLSRRQHAGVRSVLGVLLGEPAALRAATQVGRGRALGGGALMTPYHMHLGGRIQLLGT